MKLRIILAGILLAVTAVPTAAAAPKSADEPEPVSGSTTTVVETNFFCPIFPWLPMCHPR